MISSFVLSAAALLRLAAVVSAEAILIGDLAGDISSDEWASVSEAANLTQTQSFQGRDISAAFPSEPQDGWMLKVSVKDPIYAPDSEDHLTGTTLSLSPPGDVDFDDSWNLCVHVFPVQTGAGFAAEFESNCAGLVASECTEDLLRMGVEKYENGCPVFSITASCLRDLEETDSFATRINADNAGDLLGNSSSFYRRVDGPPGADDVVDANYLAAAEQPRVVVTVWGPSGESDEEATASLTCLLPDTVVGDSLDPNAPAEESGASSIAAVFGWSLVSGAVALHFLL